MNRWWSALIRLATPRHEREWVLGDIEEEHGRIAHERGAHAAAAWLRGEAIRVAAGAWRRRQGRAMPAAPQGDPAMRMFVRDLSFAWRSIRRAPAYAVTAILTIALGAGANAAVSAVTYGILFKPLPFAAPDRLVAVWPMRFQSQVDLRYLREHAVGFGDIAAIAPGWTFSLTGPGDARKITVDRVSANLFETLGAQAMLGRTLRAGEDAPGNPGRIVLSYRFWQEQLGGDRAVVGRTVKMDDAVHEIVGVMPRDFEVFRPGTDAWAPLPADPNAFYHKLNFSLFVGRLAPGVTLTTADAAFRAMMPAMRADLHYPVGFGRTARLEDLRDTTVGAMRSSLGLLAGIVVFVLLIAGANLGTLAVARGSARAKELAVHSAVGASRAALARLQLFEILVIAVLGALAGCAVASTAMPMLVGLLPANTPRTGDVRVDWSIAGLVVATSLLVSLLFGLGPALAASRGTSRTVLREGAATQSAAARRTRGVMVAVQIALALVLAIGAGLMVQSLWRLQHVDTGLDVDRILTLRLQPSSSRYKDKDAARQYYRDVLERIRAVPGVTAAGAIQHLPFSGINWVDAYEAEAHPIARGEARPTAELKLIAGDYFASVGQPVVAGRAFSSAGETAPDDVLIINAALANSLFGAPERAVGQRIHTGKGDTWRTVVGVVGDVRTRALDVPPGPEMYQAITSTGVPALMVAVRTAGEPVNLVAAVREAVWSIDRGVPVGEIQPMRGLVGKTLAEPRLLLTLLGGFAATGLALAAIGVYGVVAFAVTRRRREVGIRLALGAARPAVIGLMLRESAIYAAAGLAAGIALSLACARLLQTFLFGVAATNPVTYLALAAAVALLVLVSSYIPARAAAALSPAEALRN